jgi:hypothetical protein
MLAADSPGRGDAGVTSGCDCRRWDQPDEGVWETRGGRKDFTYGRFQCWSWRERSRAADRSPGLGRPHQGQLGNFPQAFTHMSLINSAITLNREFDAAARLGTPSLAMSE